MNLWKTAVIFCHLPLSWPDVRHKRILEEAPKQRDSTTSA
jgi:hypothetical protein